MGFVSRAASKHPCAACCIYPSGMRKPREYGILLTVHSHGACGKHSGRSGGIRVDYQRDYILRMIQMMGDMMRRLAERMDHLDRLHLLDETCRELCGISMDTGITLETDSLREMLSPIPRFMLSELLYARATACGLPMEETDALQLKALRLLASLGGEAQFCDLRAERLTALKDDVFTLLGAQDLMACARFFYEAERYDLMEDALYQALDAAAGEEKANDRREGIILLRNASKATETALALCNMTGQELRQSAFELETDAGLA